MRLKRLTSVALSSLAAGTAAWFGAGGTPEPATATHVPDFVGEHIEVTQGIQDLNQSVPLVKGKRTYVRFYARVNGGPLIQETSAILLATNAGGQQKLLLPLNPGAKMKVSNREPIEKSGWAVRMFPGLGSALFELPEGFTEGTVTLTAAVNPNLCFVDPCPPEEHNPNNNVVTRTVSFDSVLGGPTLEVYRIRYDIGNAIHVPAHSHAKQLASWLQRAYPVPKVPLLSIQTLFWPNNAVSVKTDADGNKSLTKPSCTGVNFNLAMMYFSFDPTQRRYGMVSDGGGFMRGCAPAPGRVASGPTGSGSYGWDFDGSYGDWYGGHELAHTFGRHHANFCGAKDGPKYPYPDGRISPLSIPGNTSSILAEMFGFDVQTRAIYPPWWKDVMTYCKYQWIGDATYKALRNTFRKLISEQPVSTSAGRASKAGARSSSAGVFMRVVGSIEPKLGRATLAPIFSEEAADPPERLGAGRYAIVLRGPRGTELARHPLRPLRQTPGPPAPWDRRARERAQLVLMHAVPLPADQARPLRSLDVVAPSGRVLTSVRTGIALPNVEVTAPRGGESIRQGPVEVAWQATDPDGDPLTFLVQYRPSAEAEWKSVAVPTRRQRASIPLENLASGQEASFRVLASDGLHTAAAETELPFTVVNRPPELEIVSPEDGEVFVGAHEIALDRVPFLVSQAVALEAFAHDADLGVLDGENLRWSSSVDGFLGVGAQLTVDALSEGEHTISVEADDGSDGRSEAQVAISVVGSPDDLPPLPGGLAVEPGELALAPQNGRDRGSLMVFERNLGDLGWRAEASARWLKLGATSGRTPARLRVSLVPARLPKRGNQARATVVVQSPELPGRRIAVPIVADRLRAGLSMDVKPRRPRAGSRMALIVTDARIPVRGATVKLRLGRETRRGKTNADGRTTIGVPSKTEPGRYAVSAHKRGYRPARRAIQVPR